METCYMSLPAIFQETLKVLPLICLILWALAIGECGKQNGGKCLMYLALLFLIIVIQLGKPLYNIHHTMTNPGMGMPELFGQNLWLINWYVVYAGFLLSTGFGFLFIRNGIKPYLKTVLPLAVGVLLCFALTAVLLVTEMTK